MNLDEIQPSIGIGDFKFGASKSEIVARLGNCYEVSTDDDGDVAVAYKQLSLSFQLWKDFDFRLGAISTERDTSTIFGEKVIGKSMEYLREFIFNNLQSEISEENGCIHEDGHRQEWIEVDEKNVIFWFSDNRLYLIDCFCGWENGSTPIWTNLIA
jgi:hypothetical protein